MNPYITFAALVTLTTVLAVLSKLDVVPVPGPILFILLAGAVVKFIHDAHGFYREFWETFDRITRKD
jgi:hypothetical protein